MSFGGFDPSAVARLRELPNLSAEAYATERSSLASGLIAPGAELIEAVAHALDAHLTVAKRSSVSPLHRDLRFAPQGTPRYKDHLLLTTWAGAEKKFSPTLWIRIDSDHVGFASGLAFNPELRAQWREAIGSDRGADLARAIEKIRKSAAALDSEVAGPQLKRVPSPWASDHPRADLLRMGAFQLRFREPLPATIAKPGFARWCTTRLRRLMPIHRWLDDELGAGRQRR